VPRAWERLFESPRLRTLDTEEDRRATWLELFFDLVFVVAIAELGNSLSDDVTLEGFLKFLALFVPVWWAWAGFTFYANRFDTDDLLYRVLVLIAMFAVAALATNVRDAFDGASAGFALSYVSMRLVLLALYLRAIRYVEPARALATLYFSAFALAVCVWLGSLALPEPERYWLWAAALAIELSAPVSGWRLLPQAPVDPRHLPERFGLLTIIVLGESVFAVVVGVEGVSWEASSALAAAGGFLAAACIWWIYFGFLDAPTVAGGGVMRGLVLTYSHFFVFSGIAALGIGVKLAIFSAGGQEKYDDTAWVFCVGLALCMGALAAIHLVTPPRFLDADVWLRLGTGLAAIALVPASFVLPALGIVWLLAAALVLQVVVELAAHERHSPSELDV
jgi:low temperature requirement protein LtrA